MSEPLKLCRDCRFYKKRFLIPADLGRCLHPQAIEGTPHQLVDGRPPERRLCICMRMDHSPCGLSGKLWDMR